VRLKRRSSSRASTATHWSSTSDVSLRVSPSAEANPQDRWRARKSPRLEDLRAATGANTLPADHDERGHDHKKRDGRVVNGMAGGRQSECNSGPERQRKQQGPSGLDEHPSGQGERQDQDDRHGHSVPPTLSPVQYGSFSRYDREHRHAGASKATADVCTTIRSVDCARLDAGMALARRRSAACGLSGMAPQIRPGRLASRLRSDVRAAPEAARGIGGRRESPFPP